MNKLSKVLFLICCIVLLACVSVACNLTPPEQKSVTLNYLCIDFGSSFSVEFNSDKKITNCTALNAGAEEVLAGFSTINGTVVEDFVAELLTAFQQNGYFDLNTEKILFSSSATPVAQKVLSHTSVIFEEFAYLQNISTVAVYQVMDFSDEELTNATARDAVSAGMLSLIYNANPDFSYEESLQQAKAIDNDEWYQYVSSVMGIQEQYFVLNVEDEVLIDSFTAKSIALNKLKEDDLDFYYTVEELRMDVDNARFIWSVVLKNNGDFYCFEIDAITKDILSYETRIHSSGKDIKVDKLPQEALNAVLNHAKLSQEQLSYYSIKIEKNKDGNPYYWINLKTEFSQFEYEINATNMEVITFDYASHSYRGVESKYGIVSENKAIETVKNKALVTTVSMLTVQLVYDGSWIYRIDFFVGEVYYSAEVNAISGLLMEYNADGDESTDQSEYISTKEAKEIAFDMAGRGANLKDSDVYDLSITVKKFKVDGESVVAYVVEFIYNEVKYDYTINAFDGIVLFEKTTPATSDNNSSISQEEAIEIAVAKVGCSADKVSITCNYKLANGRDEATYVINFSYAFNTYYFVIDAENGWILEYSKEA